MKVKDLLDDLLEFEGSSDVVIVLKDLIYFEGASRFVVEVKKANTYEKDACGVFSERKVCIIELYRHDEVEEVEEPKATHKPS